MKDKFKLKSYSTEISAEKSIAEIEKLLALFGVTAIMKEYTSDGRIHSLSFKIEDRGFKLPANVNGVQEVLYSGKHRYYGRDSMKNRNERAHRVAWRILKDWVHAQLSVIASGQAEPLQLFFPHAIHKSGKTLYQVYIEGKLLTQGKEEKE